MITEISDNIKLLTTKEVASELGCSPQTVRNLINSGEMPHVKITGTSRGIRIRRNDLANYISERTSVALPVKEEAEELMAQAP